MTDAGMEKGDGAKPYSLRWIKVQSTQTGLDPLITLTTAHETAFEGPCMYRISDLLKQADEWETVCGNYKNFWAYVIECNWSDVYRPLDKRCFEYKKGHHLYNPECDCRYCGSNWLALSLVLKKKVGVKDVVKTAMNTVYNRLKAVYVSQLGMAFERFKYEHLDREICKGFEEIITVVTLLDIQAVFITVYALTRDIANEILQKISLLLKRTAGPSTAKHVINYFFEAVERVHVVTTRLGVYFACFDWRLKGEGSNLMFYTIIMHGFQYLVYDRPEVRLIFSACYQLTMRRFFRFLKRKRKMNCSKKYRNIFNSMNSIREIWRDKKLPFIFKEMKIPTYNVLKIASFRHPYYDFDKMLGTTEVFEALYDLERGDLEIIVSKVDPLSDRFKTTPFLSMEITNPLDGNKTCKIRVFQEKRNPPEDVFVEGYLATGNLAFLRAHGYRTEMVDGEAHWISYEFFRCSRALDTLEAPLPGGVAYLKALSSLRTPVNKEPIKKKASRPRFPVPAKRYLDSSLIRSSKLRPGTHIPYKLRAKELFNDDEGPIHDRRDFMYDRLVDRPVDNKCRITLAKGFEFTHDLISSTFMTGVNAIGVSHLNFHEYKYYIHLEHPPQPKVPQEPVVNVSLEEVMGIQYQFLSEFGLLEDSEKEKLCYLNYLENNPSATPIREFIKMNSIGAYLQEKSNGRPEKSILPKREQKLAEYTKENYVGQLPNESDEDNCCNPSPVVSADSSPTRPSTTLKIQNSSNKSSEVEKKGGSCKSDCSKKCHCCSQGGTTSENNFLAASGLFHTHPLDPPIKKQPDVSSMKGYESSAKSCKCCEKMVKENLDEDQMDNLRTQAIKSRYGGIELSKEQYNLFTRSQTKHPTTSASSVTASPVESPEKKPNESRPNEPPNPKPAATTAANSKPKIGDVVGVKSGTATTTTSPVKPCTDTKAEGSKCKVGKDGKPEPCKSCPHTQPRNPNNAAYIEQKTRLRKKLQSNTEARPDRDLVMAELEALRLSAKNEAMKVKNEIITVTKAKGPEKDVDDIVRDIEGIKVSSSTQDPKKSAKKARQKEKKLEEIRLAEEMRLEKERKLEEERKKEEERLRKEQEEEDRKRKELEAQKKKKKKKKKKQEEAEKKSAESPSQIKCQNGETVIKMRDTGKTIVVPKEPTTGEMLTLMKTLQQLTMSESSSMQTQGADKDLTITKETFAPRANAEKGKNDMVTIRRHPTSDSTVTISVKDDNGKDDVIYTLVNGQVLSVPSGAPGSTVQKGAGNSSTGPKDQHPGNRKKKKGKMEKDEERKDPPPPPMSTNGSKDGFAQRIKYNPGLNPVDVKGPSSSKSFELFNSFEAHREEPYVNVNSLRLPPGITITKIVDQSQKQSNHIDHSTSSLSNKQMGIKQKKTYDDNVIVVDGISPNAYGEDEIFGLPYEGEEFEEVVSTKTRRMRNKTKELDVDHPRVAHTVGKGGKVFTPIPGYNNRFRPQTPQLFQPQSVQQSSGPQPGPSQPVIQPSLQQGTMPPGMLQQAAVQQGVIQQGSLPQGILQQGAVQQGTLQQPALPQGSLQQAAVQQGIIPQGPVQQGTVQPGSLQQGNVQQVNFQPSRSHVKVPGMSLPLQSVQQTSFQPTTFQQPIQPTNLQQQQSSCFQQPAPGFRFPHPSHRPPTHVLNTTQMDPKPFVHWNDGAHPDSPRIRYNSNTIMPRLNNGRPMTNVEMNEMARFKAYAATMPHGLNPAVMDGTKSASPVLSHASPQFGIPKPPRRPTLLPHGQRDLFDPGYQFQAMAMNRKKQKPVISVMEYMDAAANKKDLKITSGSPVSFDLIGSESMRTSGEENPGFARPESRSNSASSDHGLIYEKGHQNPFQNIPPKSRYDPLVLNPSGPTPNINTSCMEEEMLRARRYASNGTFIEPDAKLNYGPIGSRPNSTQRDQMSASIDPYDLNYVTLNGTKSIFLRPVPKGSPSPTPIGNERAFLKSKNPYMQMTEFEAKNSNVPVRSSPNAMALPVHTGKYDYKDGRFIYIENPPEPPPEQPVEKMEDVPSNVRDLRELFEKSGIGALNPSSKEFTGYKMFDGQPLAPGVSLENETWRYGTGDEEKTSNGWTK